MNTNKYWVLVVLLVGGLSLAASAPVAMRVEVQPLRQAGTSTEVAVIVQVSPEDRVRIGSSAILRIELDGGEVSSGSPMRAVNLEDDGSARVKVQWPPGEHDLRVEIEDPSKEDTGLWVGTVRIPDLSPNAGRETGRVTEPEPAPEPAPEFPEPAAAKPEPVPGEPEPVSPPPAEAEHVADAAVAATGATAVVEKQAPESNFKPAPEFEPEPGPEKIEPEAPDPVPEPDEDLEPLQIKVEAAIPPPAEPEVAEEKSLVEPLRADPQPQTDEPEAIAPGQQAESGPAVVPVSADLAERYEEWRSADQDTREFSVFIIRGREPAKGIARESLRLRVGGSEVPIEKLGDLENAPLLLGLAIDVAAEEIDDWSGMQGSLEPIVKRAGGGHGRLFVADSSGIGAWDADMNAPGGATLSQETGNISQLVIASLERFDGRRGRTFLVLLTDGRNQPSKEEWQRATDAAGAAGVPVFVIALWDEDFNNQTRKNLKKLAEISGGSLFLVQGRAQLESAADRFGRYLDGGYSIRFKSPDGDRQGLTSISVRASDKEVDVSAPKTIR